MESHLEVSNKHDDLFVKSMIRLTVRHSGKLVMADIPKEFFDDKELISRLSGSLFNVAEQRSREGAWVRPTRITKTGIKCQTH